MFTSDLVYVLTHSSFNMENAKSSLCPMVLLEGCLLTGLRILAFHKAGGSASRVSCCWTRNPTSRPPVQFFKGSGTLVIQKFLLHLKELKPKSDILWQVLLPGFWLKGLTACIPEAAVAGTFSRWLTMPFGHPLIHRANNATVQGKYPC